MVWAGSQPGVQLVPEVPREGEEQHLWTKRCKAHMGLWVQYGCADIDSSKSKFLVPGGQGGGTSK